jgi:hypothetical protein
VEALGGEEEGGTRHGRAVARDATELMGERGEGEAGEDFSSQPLCTDKAAGDDRGSRWRWQGGAEGRSLVVTTAMVFVRRTG